MSKDTQERSLYLEHLILEKLVAKGRELYPQGVWCPLGIPADMGYGTREMVGLKARFWLPHFSDQQIKQGIILTISYEGADELRTLSQEQFARQAEQIIDDMVSSATIVNEGEDYPLFMLQGNKVQPPCGGKDGCLPIDTFCTNIDRYDGRDD